MTAKGHLHPLDAIIERLVSVNATTVFSHKTNNRIVRRTAVPGRKAAGNPSNVRFSVPRRSIGEHLQGRLWAYSVDKLQNLNVAIFR